MTSNAAAGESAPTVQHLLEAALIPSHVRRDSWRFGHTFYLGEIAVFLMAILVVTGPLLALRYTPTPEEAHASVEALTERVPFGALIRGLHRAASYGLLVVLLAHLARVFYTAGYKEGRRLGWHSGVGLLLLSTIQSYTGYLLPWDQTGYWGSVVGASIASYVPLVGPALERLLVGGEEIGAATLVRFYVAHIVLVPGAIVAVLVAHFYSLRTAGLSRPVGSERGGAAGVEPAAAPEPEPHAGAGYAPAAPEPQPRVGAEYAPPEVALKMASLFLATLLATLALAAALPMPIEAPADPSAPPNPARAAWFARGLQELVHYSAFWGGIAAPGVAVLLLLALPWIDRGPARRVSERRGVVLAGSALLVAFLVLTVIGNFFRGPSWTWRWPWAQ